jgi:hypothetical protein
MIIFTQTQFIVGTRGATLIRVSFKRIAIHFFEDRIGRRFGAMGRGALSLGIGSGAKTRVVAGPLFLLRLGVEAFDFCFEFRDFCV